MILSTWPVSVVLFSSEVTDTCVYISFVLSAVVNVLSMNLSESVLKVVSMILSESVVNVVSMIVSDSVVNVVSMKLSESVVIVVSMILIESVVSYWIVVVSRLYLQGY
ncbi:hypothetical protein RF11_00750 [Thelohanellus kitauei]|uniref:Uncharacterized protein n=1 Tax=Thelohanellus kitauei TaxID=669202 RepID=A0A0C2N3C1_THEKT|nr:hypothetical protein RF11_00750 [Thelohanellus kitauei]